MTFSYFLLVLTPYSFLIPSCYLEGGLEILLHSSTLLFYILLLYSLLLYFLGSKTLWAAFLDFLWGFFCLALPKVLPERWRGSWCGGVLLLRASIVLHGFLLFFLRITDRKKFFSFLYTLGGSRGHDSRLH